MPASPQTLLLASSNTGKLKELRKMCAGLPFRVIAASEAGIVLPAVIEDGESFVANASKKALSAAHAARDAGHARLWTLADDSGLEVEALGGAPGIRSARYALDTTAGKGLDRAARDRHNLERLLAELGDVPGERRDGCFVCAIAVARDDRVLFTVEGTVEGRILETPRGEGGFGYDPIFLHPPSGATFAEMTPEAKAAVSHRGEAMRRLHAELARHL